MIYTGWDYQRSQEANEAIPEKLKPYLSNIEVIIPECPVKITGKIKDSYFYYYSRNGEWYFSIGESVDDAIDRVYGQIEEGRFVLYGNHGVTMWESTEDNPYQLEDYASCLPCIWDCTKAYITGELPPYIKRSELVER